MSEICPICKVNEVEVDDFGFYGCECCFHAHPKTKQVLINALNDDPTGQGMEAYNGYSN